jgi:hypothetical protein
MKEVFITRSCHFLSKSHHNILSCRCSHIHVQAVMDSQVKHNTHQRELQREAHSSALTALSSRHEEALSGLQDQILVLQLSKNTLRDRVIEMKSKTIWGNDSSLQFSVFGQWRGVHVKKLTEERNHLNEAMVRGYIYDFKEMSFEFCQLFLFW